MATSGDMFRRLGGGGTWSDDLAEIRRAHGKGASMWIAQSAGVSVRTAQRWLAGTQKPGKGASTGGIQSAAARQRAADRIRQIRRVTVGVIEVHSKSSGSDGSRQPPHGLDVSNAMDTVAALYAAGMDNQAQQLFDAAVLNAYGGDPVSGDLSAMMGDGLSGMLGIDQYQGGIDPIF